LFTFPSRHDLRLSSIHSNNTSNRPYLPFLLFLPPSSDAQTRKLPPTRVVPLSSRHRPHRTLAQTPSLPRRRTRRPHPFLSLFLLPFWPQFTLRHPERISSPFVARDQLLCQLVPDPRQFYAQLLLAFPPDDDDRPPLMPTSISRLSTCAYVILTSIAYSSLSVPLRSNPIRSRVQFLFLSSLSVR
jgi:hypothetical protein